jgi:MoxR-like ATPase
MTSNLETLKGFVEAVRGEIAKVIIGQERTVDFALVATITGQHALLEGPPGVGKTLLVRTIAKTLGCDFARIQFTPDLMPADITGTNVFNLQRGEFSLVKGPIFTSFLLADEINRAPAKTQSALLQAMQERTVTIDRDTHTLPPHFTVFATQNPIEYEGTYPLPEAQKDRFMLKVPVGYPERDQEIDLASRMLGEHSPERTLDNNEVRPAIDASHVMGMRSLVNDVATRPELVAYIVDVIRKTRSHESILVGGGPRATQALLLGSRAYAAIAYRDYVTPDDVKSMAHPVLEHRLILRPEYEIEGLTVGEVIDKVLQEVPIPR